MTRPIVIQGDRKAVAKTGVGTFTTVVFGAGVAFATTLFVSNSVGDQGTGVFFQILAFYAIASTACTFGADTGLVKTLTAHVTLGQRTLVWKTFVVAVAPVALVSIAVSIIFWISASSLAELFSGADAEALIQLLAVFIVPSSLLTVLFGGLRGFGRVGTFTSLQNVLLPCLRFAAVVAVTSLGLGAVALAAAWVAPVAAVFALTVCLVRRGYVDYKSSAGTANDPALLIPGASTPAEPQHTTTVHARHFWSFASGRGASSLLEIVLEWIDVIFVGIFLGPAAAGVYGVVNRCVRLGQMADHSARIVAGPMLGAAMAASDLVRAQAIYLMSTRLLVMVAWPFYLVLLIGGPAILSFFGPAFSEGYPALVIISCAMALAVTAGGVQSVLLMAGRSRWQLFNKLAALVVAVCANVALIPWLGLRGAAISWAAAVLVDCALATWEVHHYLGIRVPLRLIALPAALSLAVFGAGLGITTVVGGHSLGVLALGLAALGAVYVCLVWMLRHQLGLAALSRPA